MIYKIAHFIIWLYWSFHFKEIAPYSVGSVLPKWWPITIKEKTQVKEYAKQLENIMTAEQTKEFTDPPDKELFDEQESDEKTQTT